MCETNLDRRIYETIRGHTPDTPQTLHGIIGCVDASQRLVLTHEELSEGLKRLVSAGYVAEIDTHRYCDVTGTDSPSGFSGITESDHAAAVEVYRKRFQQQLEGPDDELDHDDFAWKKLILRWVTPNDRWPTDEDNDSAEQLAAKIHSVLAQSGLGEINGFECGQGHVDVLIFGKATDSDVDQIYDLLAPTFRQFNCTPASRIIRFYQERDEEVESDIVSA